METASTSRQTARLIALATCALLATPAAFAPAAAEGGGGAEPEPLPYHHDVENGTAGWAATGLWHVTTDRSAGGNHSWYYGDERGPGLEDNTYDTNGTANRGTLTSPPINLSTAFTPSLSFSFLWDGEGGAYEHPIVEVSTNGSDGPFEVIYEAPDSTAGTNGTWNNVELQLHDYGGEVLHVRFVWDTIDAVANDGEGWYLDDVRVNPWSAWGDPRPDLRPTDLTLFPSDPVAGDTVTFTVHVHNLGNATAENFTVDFRLDDGTPIGSVDVSSASPGGFVIVQTHWTAVPGTYRATAQADPEDAITEAHEWNNEIESARFTVAEAPDLVVDAVTHAPAEPREEDAVELTATVRNRGAGDAGNFTLRFIRLGHGVLEDVEVPGLAANATTDVTVVWNATEGNWTFLVVADVHDAVNETDEDNNEASTVVDVGPPRRPNLTLGTVTLDPPTPTEGDEVVFTARVRNDGEADAGPFTVRFVLDGALLDEVSLPGKSTGGHWPVTAVWNATPLNHTLEVIVDPADSVNETDETDNRVEVPFMVNPLPPPDLTVETPTLDPAAPREGDAVSLTARVTNSGGADVANFTVRFTLDGTVLAEAEVAALAAGASANVTVPWNATPFNHTLEVLADAYDVVDESDETNNTATLAFHVTPLPDLTVETPTLDPAAPREGDAVNLTARVTNHGAADAANFTVRFLLDGDVLADVEVVGLAAGASVDVTVPWNAKPFDHTLEVHVDAGHDVEETDETNNTATLDFTVTPLPDLVPASLTVSPAEPSLGQLVTFTARIENQGGAAAGNFSVLLLLDGAAHAQRTVYGLRSGAYVNVTSTWLATELGNHTVRVVVDHLARVDEVREDNNERETPFQVRTAP